MVIEWTQEVEHMTLEQLQQSKQLFVAPADISEILRCDP